MAQAPDAQQFALAARSGWILVTHNRRDFKLLHDAWIHWTGLWQIQERHAGIMLFPHGHSARDMAREIHRFLQGTPLVANRLYEWTVHRGWVQH